MELSAVLTSREEIDELCLVPTRFAWEPNSSAPAL